MSDPFALDLDNKGCFHTFSEKHILNTIIVIMNTAGGKQLKNEVVKITDTFNISFCHFVPAKEDHALSGSIVHGPG